MRPRESATSGLRAAGVRPDLGDARNAASTLERPVTACAGRPFSVASPQSEAGDEALATLLVAVHDLERERLFLPDGKTELLEQRIGRIAHGALPVTGVAGGGVQIASERGGIAFGGVRVATTLDPASHVPGLEHGEAGTDVTQRHGHERVVLFVYDHGRAGRYPQDALATREVDRLVWIL